jgi:hypothetical protein
VITLRLTHAKALPLQSTNSVRKFRCTSAGTMELSVGCCIVWSGTQYPTFRSSLLPPSSDLALKRRPLEVSCTVSARHRSGPRPLSAATSVQSPLSSLHRLPFQFHPHLNARHPLFIRLPVFPLTRPHARHSTRGFAPLQDFTYWKTVRGEGRLVRRDRGPGERAVRRSDHAQRAGCSPRRLPA